MKNALKKSITPRRWYGTHNTMNIRNVTLPRVVNSVLVSVSFLLAMFVLLGWVIDISTLVPNNSPQAETGVSQQVFPVLNSVLLPICSCESTGKANGTPRQFNSDGSVVRGSINRYDIGECQINVEPRYGHLKESRKLGFDIYSKRGNILYANWLFKRQGTAPWKWSKPCWHTLVDEMTTTQQTLGYPRK